MISTRNHSNGSLLAPLPQMIDKRDCWRRLLIALRFDLRMLSRCYRRILTAVAHRAGNPFRRSQHCFDIPVKNFFFAVLVDMSSDANGAYTAV